MLNGLRKAGQSWLGKLLIAILFGLIIVSFAIWGIGDIFRGGGRNVAVSVGKTEISADQIRTAYQAELQRLIRQFRRNITPDQARAYGIDAQVLGRMVSEATLDERTRQLGLHMSDALAAKTILNDPGFKGATAKFDRAVFEETLRENNLTEAGFVRQQKAAIARKHIIEALTAEIKPPLALKEAIYRYGAERRDVAYLILPAGAGGTAAAPGEDTLAAFFNERKNQFNAPEYRTLTVLALQAETLAKANSVDDAEALKIYDEVKTARYGSPERRRVQQLVFPTLDEAKAVQERLKGGAAFDAIARERGVSGSDLDLGLLPKAQMFDAVLAEAAFSLPLQASSEVLQGRFGPVIVKVTEIQPESVRPFAAVSNELKQGIALARAQAQIALLHDKIEDARSGAKPLGAIAKDEGLELIETAPLTRQGLDRMGQPVALPEQEALLAAAFVSDIGIDNEALRTKSGYVWFEVTAIEPARPRTLDEVRDEAAAQWQAEENDRLAKTLSSTLLQRIEQGESLETIGAELSLPVEKAIQLARNAPAAPITPEAAARIFATPSGKAGDTELKHGEARLLYQVETALLPPFVTSTREAETLGNRLQGALIDDILSQYLARAQKDIGLSIDQAALRRAIGGEN